MTEVAIPTGREIAAVEVPMTGLVKWAFDAQQANQIAKSLSKTSFVPATMRGKPDDITAAILAGDELGLKPMAALRSMDIIQGTPALRAHSMRGLVQAHGHDIEMVESGPDRCVMRGRRKGAENWQQVEWTIQRAAKLGLTAKDQWKKQPQTMLIARATGEICRLVAADVLLAMPYTAEELGGGAHEASAGVSQSDVPTAAEVMGELTAGPAGAVSDTSDPAEVAEALAELDQEQGLLPDDPDLFVEEEA